MSHICWNAIVKNESERIVRCMASLKPYISSYCIVDTGSIDITADLIRDYLSDIPGEIHHVPFENFEQARNAGLKLARESNIPWDYLLLADADMELVVDKPDAFDHLVGLGYDMEQRTNTLVYMNRRLISRGAKGNYIGVTHEFLNVPSLGAIRGAYFKDHADGSNRVKKYERDIRLLTEALDKDPMNGRYWFYLGQSYRDAGDNAKALDAYSRRIALGGWEEETWNSMVNKAACYNNLGDGANFVSTSLDAYNFRPSRAESLYDLARHFRIKGKNASAAAFAEIGMGIPRTSDSLFVNDFVYTSGLREEFSIAGFYVPHLRDRAFHVCDDLALDPKAYPAARNGARQNLFFYLPKLGEIAPSYQSRPIDPIPLEPGYAPMNPSITRPWEQVQGILRTVNYTMTPAGGYAVVGPNPEITADSPIRTKNYLLKFNKALQVTGSKEILMPDDWPDPKYKLVLGFEDMRLFQWLGSLWFSATVRELNDQGYCEQVLGRIVEDKRVARATAWRVMRHELPRGHEKNWMPWVDRNALRFVYRPGETVDEFGATVSKVPTRYDVGHLSGGTQVIPFGDFGLALTHESCHHPHTHQRYYQHRFVQLTRNGAIEHISLPFVFQDKQIEFAAGICWIDPGHIAISYGVRDASAHIATVVREDIEGVLAWRK